MVHIYPVLFLELIQVKEDVAVLVNYDRSHLKGDISLGGIQAETEFALCQKLKLIGPECSWGQQYQSNAMNFSVNR